MGQPISVAMRECILACPNVLRATAEHVVLKNGRVLDPDDFVVEERSAQFVLKRTSSGNCFLRLISFGLAGHKEGDHLIVVGVVQHYATGRTKNRYRMPIRLCCENSWNLEEVVTSSESKR